MSNTRHWQRTSLLALVGTALCLVLMIDGCSSKNANKKSDKPSALIRLVNHFPVTRVWRSSMSGEAPKLRLGLGVAADEHRAFVASYKGQIEALDVNTGRRLWTRNLKAPLSGGPGLGGGLVVVATSKGEIIALSDSDGAPRWRVRINAEILCTPAVGGDLVVVTAVDGKMHALSSADGTEQWVVDQQVPRLSLRGSSEPLLVGDLAISGFDNGRVVAVLRRNGTTAWDAAIGQSHGSTELQRLIDVDSGVVADVDDVFAVAYQGRVVKLSRDSGQIQWARDVSSYRGLSVDANSVYVATADGDVVSLDRSNGTERWRQKSLERRQLSAPVVYQGHVVVADLAGYVHWLDAANGNILARTSAGKKRVSGKPLVDADLLLVFTDDGQLSAFRAPAAPGPAAATVGSAPAAAGDTPASPTQ